MTKHTPGPWVVDNGFGRKLWIGVPRVPGDVDHYGFHTIITGIDINGQTVEARAVKEANAHLIAAAPELLEACGAVDAYLSNRVGEKSDSQGFVILSQIRAAIAKAKGEV